MVLLRCVHMSGHLCGKNYAVRLYKIIGKFTFVNKIPKKVKP